MVQKPATNADKAQGRRGRPPRFDPQIVVMGAVEAFWQRGFEATTLGDLERATGADRSTLYNSFGGKAGLYQRAVDIYLDRADQELFGPLLDEDLDGYEAMAGFLQRLRAGLASPDTPPGCMIVNDLADHSAPEAAHRYVTSLEVGIKSALSRTGMGPEPRVLARAQMITASVLGISLLGKAEPESDAAADRVNAILAEVESWRIASLPDS